MARLQIAFAAMVIGLGGCSGGGGDGGGGGGGGGAVTPSQATALCMQSCDFDATCQPEDVDLNCQADCESQVAFNYSFSAVSQFLDCSTASCEVSEDACLLGIPIREVDRQFEAACNAYFTMCPSGGTDFCDINEPEGGAFLKLFMPDVISAAAECFDATCEEEDVVNNCIDSVFGFAG